MNLEQKDRIGPYLRPHLGQFIFDELSENYLKRAGMTDILSDVPSPLRKTELSNITTLTIARNMAFVIGVDRLFNIGITISPISCGRLTSVSRRG